MVGVPHSLQVGPAALRWKKPTDHVKSVSGGRIQAFRIANNFFYRVWVYTKSTKKELDRSIKYFRKSITLKLGIFRESGANSDVKTRLCHSKPMSNPRCSWNFMKKWRFLVSGSNLKCHYDTHTLPLWYTGEYSMKIQQNMTFSSSRSKNRDFFRWGEVMRKCTQVCPQMTPKAL